MLPNLQNTRILLCESPEHQPRGARPKRSSGKALVIMAQVGSYVPAESMRFSPVDAIFTRMGAEDMLSRGLSTFMVELIEASLALRDATPDSLVILDELGRGSSTTDGRCIAAAALRHLVNRNSCTTIFATHFAEICAMAEELPDRVRNSRFDYLVNDDQSITYLFKMVDGVAGHSHGLSVARAAGLPASLLASAEAKSSELEMRSRVSTTLALLAAGDHAGLQHLQKLLQVRTDI